MQRRGPSAKVNFAGQQPPAGNQPTRSSGPAHAVAAIRQRTCTAPKTYEDEGMGLWFVARANGGDAPGDPAEMSARETGEALAQAGAQGAAGVGASTGTRAISVHAAPPFTGTAERAVLHGKLYERLCRLSMA